MIHIHNQTAGAIQIESVTVNGTEVPGVGFPIRAGESYNVPISDGAGTYSVVVTIDHWVSGANAVEIIGNAGSDDCCTNISYNGIYTCNNIIFNTTTPVEVHVMGGGC
jgi:hypothetical protein